MYVIVAIAILGLIVPGCIPVVPPAEQNESGSLPNKVIIDVGPGESIQAAITAANFGDIINVAAGTYVEGFLVFSTDAITLIGSGVDTTTIITSSNTYGVSVPSGVDDIKIINLTIEEDDTYNTNTCGGTGSERFHLKISHNSGFTLENVNLEGPGKDNSCIVGLDLNSVQNVIVRNVHISGYSTNGVGVVTATSNLLFEDVTIEGNGYTGSTGWAGISFYTMGGGDITDVQFAGTNTISNNPMGVFIENVKYIGGGDVHITGTGTTTLSGNLIPLVATNLGDLSIVDVYAKNVFNVPVRLEDAFASPPEYSILVSYWHDVTSAGIAANDPLVNGNPVIFNLTNEEWYVVAGMSIQAAVDAASNGDTINVCAGEYAESVSVVGFTDLTIKAQGAGHPDKSVLVNPPATGFTSGFEVYSDGVTIEGFEIEGTNFGIWFEGSNNKFSNNYINNIYSTDNWWDGGVGISLWDMDGGSNYNTITNNVIENIERTGVLLDIAWSDGGTGINTENSIVRNEISNTPWGAIEVLNAEYTTINHNIISDCGAYGGVALFNAETGVESNYNTIAHNEIDGDPWYGHIWIYPWAGSASYNKIHHNTADTYVDWGTNNKDFKNSWN